MAAMEEDDNLQGSFELDSYISAYSGHNKIDRLLFVAEKAAGKALELEALKMAHDEVKKTDNIVRYSEVVNRINGRLGPSYQLDRAFMDQVDRRATVRQERLENELHGYKTNLIKESIRMGHTDLGDFFYERGDLENAFKCYIRSRDYCNTSKHILSMCLSVIRVANELNNYMHVSNHVAKAEQTPDMQLGGSGEKVVDQVVVAKLKAAAGLALLHGKKYKQAARKFLEVNAELGNEYSDVVAAQDIALYGGLCALATFDRADLKSKVIQNLAFKEYLELEPRLRELVHDFYNSRYASCLTHLEALKPLALMDIHLQSHVLTLYKQIRQKALTQYTAPFGSVDLATMATAFNTTVSDLEKELASLIMEGQVQARIDSHNKVLYARLANIRSQTFQRVLSCGEQYVRETKAMLLRANLLQHDFQQKPRHKALAAEGSSGPSRGMDGGGGFGHGMRGGDPHERPGMGGFERSTRDVA